MSLKRSLLIACLGAASALSGVHAQNLLTNGDFENGAKGWNLFAPPAAEGSECKFEAVSDTPHDGGQCGRLSSVGEARYAITSSPRGLAPTPGDRYRLTAWVRAGQDFTPRANTPGFVIRVTLFGDPGYQADVPGGHVYLGVDNRAFRGVDVSPLNNEPIPKEWTKLECVFAIPEGTASLNVAVFVWQGSGSVFVDDVSLENVDNSTPLTVTENN
jgi:hypothetical protein